MLPYGITRQQWVNHGILGLVENAGYAQYTRLTDVATLRRPVANQQEVMTRLLELLYVLNIKRNIF